MGYDNKFADEILAGLKEKGIENLTEFINFQLERNSKFKSTVTKIDFSVFYQETPKQLASKILYKVPKFPFEFENKIYNPDEIINFNGNELNFVLTKKSSGEDIIMAFTKKIDMLNYVFNNKYINTINNVSVTDPWPGSSEWCPPGSLVCSTPSNSSSGGAKPAPVEARACQDAYGKGDWFWITEGYGYPDLSNIPRGWFHNWNDEISSIYNNNNMYVLCCEHANYQGASFMLQKYQSINDLSTIGMNDRISSIMAY